MMNLRLLVKLQMKEINWVMKTGEERKRERRGKKERRKNYMSERVSECMEGRNK